MGRWWIAVSVCAATIAMGAPATAPTTQALQREFPWVIFDEDFSGYADTTHPPTWEVVRHSIHAHQHGWVHDGTYAVLNSSNWHCPRVPPQKDFVLEFKAKADPSTDVALVLVHFRLNVRARTGYTLFYRWGKRFGVRCTLHAVQGWSSMPRSTRSSTPKPDVAHWARLRLVVIGQHIRFYHDDTLQGEWHETTNRHTAAGRIALDIVGCNPPVPGPKYLDDVRIRARRPRKRTLVWKQDRVRVPIRTAKGDPGALVFRLTLTQVDPVDVFRACVRLTAPFGKTPAWHTTRVLPRVEVMDPVGRVVGTCRLAVGPLQGCLASTALVADQAILSRRVSHPLLRIHPGVPGSGDVPGSSANPDYLCDLRVGRWVPLPGTLRNGIALGIDAVGSPGVQTRPDRLSVPPEQEINLDIRAAAFAQPGPGTACEWTCTGTDRSMQRGVAYAQPWIGPPADAVRTVRLHPVRFRLRLPGLGHGRHHLQTTTWMGGQHRRTDTVTITVSKPR